MSVASVQARAGASNRDRKKEPYLEVLLPLCAIEGLSLSSSPFSSLLPIPSPSSASLWGIGGRDPEAF